MAKCQKIATLSQKVTLAFDLNAWYDGLTSEIKTEA